MTKEPNSPAGSALHRTSDVETTPAQGFEGDSADVNSTRATVMVIDDSKTIRRSAENLLQKEGWSVVTAVDGFDALAKVVEHEPDLVLADIMMPRLDGYQTCALIKNNDRYSHTPVIMLSSKDSLFDKARGRVVGSDQYLTKPFSRDELISTVRKHLQNRPVKRRKHGDTPASALQSTTGSAVVTQ